MNQNTSGRVLPRPTKPIRWHFDFQMSFLFEIDVAAIDRRLPSGCYPLEVRPGVGLMLIGAQRAPAGNLGQLPPFMELDWTIAVQPDLSRDMPTPRFAFAQGAMVSECADFAEHAFQVDKLISAHLPSLRGTFDDEAMSVAFVDDSGPILSMSSTHTMAPVFHERTYWGQQTTRLADGTWSQAWSWTGAVFEHQQGYGRRVAEVHQHPIFDGIDVRGIGERCYMQMIARPGAAIEMVFYEPVRIGPGHARQTPPPT